MASGAWAGALLLQPFHSLCHCLSQRGRDRAMVESQATLTLPYSLLLWAVSLVISCGKGLSISSIPWGPFPGSGMPLQSHCPFLHSHSPGVVQAESFTHPPLFKSSCLVNVSGARKTNSNLSQADIGELRTEHIAFDHHSLLTTIHPFIHSFMSKLKPTKILYLDTMTV